MIVLAYDHRAYKLMQQVEKHLVTLGHEVCVFASPEYNGKDSYAEFARPANEKMIENPENVGIYSCRTGIGICMAGNRKKGVRAGVCHDTKTTFLARNDDDMNVLVLPAEYVSFKKAKKIIDVFLSTPFEGGRHTARVNLLDKD